MGVAGIGGRLPFPPLEVLSTMALRLQFDPGETVRIVNEASPFHDAVGKVLGQAGDRVLVSDWQTQGMYRGTRLMLHESELELVGPGPSAVARAEATSRLDAAIAQAAKDERRLELGFDEVVAIAETRSPARRRARLRELALRLRLL